MGKVIQISGSSDGIKVKRRVKKSRKLSLLPGELAKTRRKKGHIAGFELDKRQLIGGVFLSRKGEGVEDSHQDSYIRNLLRKGSRRAVGDYRGEGWI